MFYDKHYTLSFSRAIECTNSMIIAVRNGWDNYPIDGTHTTYAKILFRGCYWRG